MTERIDLFADYIHEPIGSLWVNEPAYVSGVSPEEWERAAKTLRAVRHVRGRRRRRSPRRGADGRCGARRDPGPPRPD